MTDKPAIIGYRVLHAEEIALINEGKALAEKVREFCAKVGNLPVAAEGVDISCGHDPSWFATGKTDLQKGFMAVIRSIARPTTF